MLYIFLRACPTGKYFFKVNDENTRTTYEISLKLTMKALELPRYNVFIVNFEQADFIHSYGVCIVDCEQVNDSWDNRFD